MTLPAEISLFPLGTCLFPGGNLPLRIFEPRYLSMVSACLREELPFGVVLIREGNEAGTPATFHDIGTTARIVDFDQLEDGMLGLTCQGDERFRVTGFDIQEDGLVIGQVETVADQCVTNTELLSRHESVSGFLRETLDRKELEDYRAQMCEDWSNTDWISFQTAELLPLSPESRQLLLEMSVAERLVELDSVLRDNNLV